ncbi:MAG: hypothetical protein OWV35_09075 [Firmicutes bacterium]|nr:hypothetical protein [Bacillota bacterium]
MRVSVKQVFVVIASFLVTLGALWAAERIYVASQVRTPFLQAVRRTPGVAGAWLNGRDLVLQLQPGADLETVYDTVQARAAASGQAMDAVLIRDRASPALRALDNELSFVVAQGIATGQFVAMRQQILADAARARVQAQVSMDRGDIFLTLRQGSAVLYQVIPVAKGADPNA